MSSPTRAARGALAATASFLFWGLVPLYWKQMSSIASIELIMHRIVWSLLFLMGILAWQNNLQTLRAAFAYPRLIGLNLLSSLLLAANWTVYIWAVNHGQVIESSLGYFLVPLVNVALGSLFLHERLRALQWLAISLAPSVQFLLGYFLYHEPFDLVHLQAYACIWTGLLLYTGDGFWAQRHHLRAST